MSIDWSKFDAEEGEAWGAGPGRCPNGEFNVRIASAADEGGVLTVEFNVIEPDDAKGRSVRATYITDAVKSGKSERAAEVTMNLLRGMMRAAKVPRGAFPSKWVGLELCIEVVDDTNPQYAKIKRYSPKAIRPLGIAAATVRSSATFDDDSVPF